MISKCWHYNFIFQVPDNTTTGNQCEKSFSKECCNGRDGANRIDCFRSLVCISPLSCASEFIIIFSLTLGRDGRDGQNGEKQLCNNFSLWKKTTAYCRKASQNNHTSRCEDFFHCTRTIITKNNSTGPNKIKDSQNYL